MKSDFLMKSVVILSVHLFSLFFDDSNSIDTNLAINIAGYNCPTKPSRFASDLVLANTRRDITVTNRC